MFLVLAVGFISQANAAGPRPVAPDPAVECANVTEEAFVEEFGELRESSLGSFGCCLKQTTCMYHAGLSLTKQGMCATALAVCNHLGLWIDPFTY